MPKLLRVFIVPLILFNSCIAQKVGIKGSFFIGAIGSNGIMVASESRGSIYDLTDSAHSTLAYFDDMQKTVIMDKYAFAETGNGLYGGIFFKSIIDHFAMSFLMPPPISQLFNKLLNFWKQSMPYSVYKLFSTNLMIVAGYQDNKPSICYYNGLLNYNGCISISGFVESDTTIFTALYSDTLSCEKLGIIAEKAIYKYANNKNNISIGGPVRILKIDSTGPHWLKNKPIFNWNNWFDFLSDYNNHKIKLKYTSKENVKKVKELFDPMQR